MNNFAVAINGLHINAGKDIRLAGRTNSTPYIQPGGIGDDDSAVQEKMGGYASTAPQEVTFSINPASPTPIYIYGNNNLRFYSIKYEPAN